MLKTEMRNPDSMHIDKMTSLEMVALMNKENMNSVLAVEKALPTMWVRMPSAMHWRQRMAFGKLLL